MFYKLRKMEAEDKQIVHRVGQLPMVKAAGHRMTSIYELIKNSNRLIFATFQLAEDSIKTASEAEAVKKILDSSFVVTVNQVAVNQLDVIEQKYPVVRKTPDEMWNTGKDYYEHSRLKKKIDQINAAKAYSVDKINGTKKYYKDLVSNKLEEMLDFSDSMVDKYVAVHSEANGHPPQCDTNGTYFNRVQCISGKLYYGVKHRAGDKYEATKQYLLQTVGDLHVAMQLIQYVKNKGTWAVEKARGTMTMAQEQTKNLWQEGVSEAMVLGLVQGLAANIAALSQQVAKYSSPYLPESVEIRVSAGAAYAIEMRDTFAKAKSLGDLRDEFISEAKRKLTSMQEGLMNGIEYLRNVPSAVWPIPMQPQLEQGVDAPTIKVTMENGHINNGDNRDGQ